MDIVDGDLRSDGKASVKVDDNPQGIELLEMELPVHRITPQVADKLNFVRYLMEKTVELRTKFGMFVSMEMSRKTFINSIIGSKDFGEFYKQSFDSKEMCIRDRAYTLVDLNFFRNTYNLFTLYRAAKTQYLFFTMKKARC